MSCLAPGLGSLAGRRQGRAQAGLGAGRAGLSATAGLFFGGGRLARWEPCMGRGTVPGLGGANAPETEQEPGCRAVTGGVWHRRHRAPGPWALPAGWWGKGVAVLP